MALHPNLESVSARDILVESRLRARPMTMTLGAALVLSKDHPPLLFIDPGGAGRNVDLPNVADSVGLVFMIVNRADAAEILTVRHSVADGGATVVTPTQGEAAFVFCSGAVWSGLVGASS